VVWNFKKKRHLIFVKNSFPPEKDPRLIKEAPALRKAGYFITFLCWDQLCKNSSKYEACQNNYNVVKLELRVPLSHLITYHSLFGYLLLPIWWFFVLKWHLKNNWDVVHVINFPSLPPAIIAGKLKGRPVIYEIEDTWFDQTVLPSWLRLVFLSIDNFFMRFSTAVILVDEMQIIEFGEIPNPNVVVIYDSAVDIYKKVKTKRQEIYDFTIFYAGALTERRRLNLNKIIAAIKEVDGVKVIFAGYGDLVDELKSWAVRMPNKVEFIGRVPYHEVLRRSLESNLLFVLRDPTLLLYKYICGSKVFEAMMCGKPILVNKGTSTAIKVLKNKCGVVVDGHNVEKIKEAILKLKNDRDLCKRLGMNGRIAYEQKYSWNLMRQRLLNLYAELIR